MSIPSAGAPAAGVVEELDVVVDRIRELDPGLPAFAVEELDHRYRTRRNGKFNVRYRFTRTQTTDVMRAQVRATTGYPYLPGNSQRALQRETGWARQDWVPV